MAKQQDTGLNWGWGIVRFAPHSGMTADDECAGFDHWYNDRATAERVYDGLCKAFPEWTIALVWAEKVRFSKVFWGGRTKQKQKQGTICPLKWVPHGR